MFYSVCRTLFSKTILPCSTSKISCIVKNFSISSSQDKILRSQPNLSHFLRVSTAKMSSTIMSKEFVSTRYEDDIVKSGEDKRLYRYLKLKNSMQVFLISDSSTDKSAAAMDVHIGSMSDPWEIPGLAHFCEHMLFLGTEKYPSENEYNKYLSEHSGSSNAYTSCDHTNYYFDVAPDAFKGALDRFAQFFLEPLFTESCVEREVKAVHSEHEKNIASDNWRIAQLERSTSHPDHDYSKFGTGNKTTLFDDVNKRGECVRDALLQFHQKWYSANAMGLTVLGKESLDELEEMVVGLFTGVENKDVTIPSWPQHPFTAGEVRKMGYVVPIKDIRSLNITWPIPDMHPHYRSAPGQYLGHLIGHEGEGSLLSFLKAKGYVNSLVGGQKSGAKGFAFFCVNVNLTEEGIDHIDDIALAVFQYLEMLKIKGPQQWVFEEIKDLSSTSFRFKDKERPQSYVSCVAESLHYFPPEDVLCGGYLLKTFDAPLVTSLLQKLTPENARLAIVGKKMEKKATKTEKWYGTQYNLEDISDEKINAWKNPGVNPELSLPQPNHFIPKNVELYTNPDEVTVLPTKIQSDPFADVWFKLDTEYKLPKCVFYAEFFSPIAYLDPHNTNLLHMFAQLFRDALTEYSYDAELAGLDYSLNNSKYGLTLNLRGYYDKQPVLLRKIMEKLTNFKVDAKRFEMLKDSYVRALCNFSADQPHQHVVYYTSLLLSQHGWCKEDLLCYAREHLTVPELEKFIPQFLAQLHCQIMVHGSVSRQWALDLASLVTTPLLSRTPPTKPLLECQRHRQREIRLPKGSSFVFRAENTVHTSSAVEVILQGDVQDTKSNSLFELVSQVLHEPAFDELRTKEQLGYIVWSGVRRSNGTQGFRVIVQSPFPPAYLDDRIEAFLHKSQGMLESLTDEQFQRHKEALVQRRLERPKKMQSLSMRWWSEIVSNQYNFDRDNVEVEFIRSISKEDLLKHFMKYLSSESSQRAKLSVRVLGTEGNKQTLPEGDSILKPPPIGPMEEISNISVFKSSMSLYPLQLPYVAPAADSKAKL